jgi:hypothetical protein
MDVLKNTNRAQRYAAWNYIPNVYEKSNKKSFLYGEGRLAVGGSQ